MKKKVWGILGLALGTSVALFAATGWCVVAPGEVVVVRHWGRVIEPPWGPGLHWRYPLGIDQLARVRNDSVRQLTIGLAGPAGPSDEPGAGEIITGDLNLLKIQATVQYRVANPAQYMLSALKVEPLLSKSADSGLARALAERGVDAVLRSERQAIARDAARDLQTFSDHYLLGVTILGVSLTDARPPAEVEADFAAAQAAESERDRRINDAKNYEDTTATAAQSAAEAKLEAAHAAADRRTLTARAEAERFTVLLAEAQRSRSLTMRRIYIETLQSLLDRVQNKLILPPGGDIDLTLLGVKDQSAPSPTDSSAAKRIQVPNRATRD
jgi:membrane protease subunit HflK